MSPELVQIALRKQRLQLRCAEQREAIVHHAQGLAPVFKGIDRIADGVHWARNNAPILSGIAVFMLVARPRAALRWARRGWLGWQMFRRFQKLVS